MNRGDWAEVAALTSLFLFGINVGYRCTKRSDTRLNYRNDIQNAVWYQVDNGPGILEKGFRKEGRPKTKYLFDEYKDIVAQVNGFADAEDLENYEGEKMWLPDKNGDGKIAGNDVSGYPAIE